jgi:hypothetical protein
MMFCCRDGSGIQYLTYNWPSSGNCIIFDESNTVLDAVYGIIEEGRQLVASSHTAYPVYRYPPVVLLAACTAIQAGESVLIHSVDGRNRACFCSAVYFILKYRW